jgi:hypothetical protein
MKIHFMMILKIRIFFKVDIVSYLFGQTLYKFILLNLELWVIVNKVSYYIFLW